MADKTRLAFYLGRSPSWLSSNLGDLQMNYGFPLENETLGVFDLRRVDEWLDGGAGRAKIKGKRINGAFK